MIALRRVFPSDDDDDDDDEGQHGSISSPGLTRQGKDVAGVVRHERTKAMFAYSVQVVDMGPKAVSKIRSKIALEEEIIHLGEEHCSVEYRQELGSRRGKRV